MKTSYSLQKTAELFHSQSKTWWIAGGLAIDLFLGEETRDHEDIDVSILRKDEKHFRTFLDSWELWPGLGNDGLDNKPIEANDELPSQRDVLWCRPSSDANWAFEILTSRTDGDMWIFKRDDRVRMPISEIGKVNRDGIPFLRPEIILLFKAKNIREKDQHDFDAVAHKLNKPEWLKKSLEKVHPGHQWIKRL